VSGGYFLSADAEEDLQDIYLYTDDVWGQRQARLYLTRLYDLFDHLGRNPAMGRSRPEIGEGIRSFPHGAHIVFFMKWEDEVAIVRVLHGSMDIDSLFGNDDLLSSTGRGET